MIASGRKNVSLTAEVTLSAVRTIKALIAQEGVKVYVMSEYFSSKYTSGVFESLRLIQIDEEHCLSIDMSLPAIEESDLVAVVGAQDMGECKVKVKHGDGNVEYEKPLLVDLHHRRLDSGGFLLSEFECRFCSDWAGRWSWLSHSIPILVYDAKRAWQQCHDVELKEEPGVATINLFKIEGEKEDEFLRALDSKTRREPKQVKLGDYSFTCFFIDANEKGQLSWNWVLRCFGFEGQQNNPQPSAVVVVSSESATMYAVTFGNAFFLVNKYCDRDFAFSFCRKLVIKDVRTTTRSTPNYRRNKTLDTFKGMDTLDFDCGESFQKIRMVEDTDTELYKHTVDIGTSVRFEVKNGSLEAIRDLIVRIEEALNEWPDVNPIPLFTVVKDKDKIAQLEETFSERLRSGDMSDFSIAELEIIGSREVFNWADQQYCLKCDEAEMEVSYLDFQVVSELALSIGRNLEYVVNHASIVISQDGKRLAKYSLRKYVDYHDDDQKCLLNDGRWYSYNSDFLKRLDRSISEISTVNDPAYDFTASEYEAYVKEKWELEVKQDLEKRKKYPTWEEYKAVYYAERVFNLLKEHRGFVNLDRELSSIHQAKLELMDLYKEDEEVLLTVKMGRTSSSLCYAVTQSSTALRAIKLKPELLERRKISKIGLWFVLPGEKPLKKDESGRVCLEDLNMLYLKNEMGSWLREVRLSGYQPVVYVNYDLRKSK